MQQPDARDACVIAETVRHRGDLTEVEVSTALVTELRLLVAHRGDQVADRAHTGGQRVLANWSINPKNRTQTDR